MASSSLTEANVEARDFRLEYADELLQSIKKRRHSPVRDPPIEDPQATIARLHRELATKDIEISRLRVGTGAIGPILAANLASDTPAETRAEILSRTEPVARFLARMFLFAGEMGSELYRGRHSELMTKNYK